MSTSLYSVHDNFNARIGSAKPPTSTSAASVVLQTAAEVTPWRETAEGHGTLQPIAPETSHVVLPRDPPTSALNRGAFTAEEATAAARINAHVRELAERVSAYASFAEEVLRVEAVKSFTASAFAILKRASAGRVQEQDLKKLSEELFTHWVMHVSNDAAYAPGLDSITRLPPGSSVPSQSQRLRQQAILSIDAGKVVFHPAAVSSETSEAERVTGTLAGPVDAKNWELVTITDSSGRVHEFPATDVFLATPQQIDPDVLIPTGEAYPDRGTCVVVYQRCLHATKADKAASKIAALEITARATSLRVALGAAKDRIGAIVAAALSKLSSGTAADALPIFNEISALASELTGGMQRLPIFSSMSEVPSLVTRSGSIAFRSVIAAEGRGSQVLELSCGSVTCPVLSAAYERFKALYANAGGLEIFDAESETAKHDRVVALAAKVPSMAPAPWSVDVTPIDDTHPAAPPAHTLKPEVPEGVVLSGPQPEGRTVALGSPNTPFDTLAFHLRLMTVLLRYFALAGASDMCDLNAGFHAAIHPEFMRALRTEFGVSAECFGSPFNAVSPRFCSLFPDVDRYFGSCGKFFDFAPSSANGGAFHVNPPFATNVMQRMAGRMLELLSDNDGTSTTDAASAQPDEDSTAAETTTANSAADDDATVGASTTPSSGATGSKPLTFVMVIPSWTGPKLEAAIKSVMQSEYCVFRTEISPGDAVYIDGHQHALGRPYFALETKTLMAVFQNKAAQRKFSSDEFKVLPSVLAKQKPKHELVVRAMAGRCIQQWALASQTALPSQPKKRAR